MFNKQPSTKLFIASIILTCSTPLLAEPGQVAERGRVSAVTVYPAQALVTREVTLDQDAGEIELIIGDLPSAIRPDSLEASGDKTLQVHDVHHRLTGAKPDDAALISALEALEDERISNAMQREGLSGQSRQLDGLASFTAQATATDLHRGILDADVLERITLFGFAQRERLAERLGKLQREARRLDARAQDLRLELDKLSTTHAEPVHEALIRLTKSRGGQGTLRLTYVVDRVSWQPVYKVRAAAGAASIDIEYGARLRQESGEDWRNVELTLSSTVPGNRAEAPSLQPLTVVLKKGEPDTAAARAASGRQLREFNVDLRPGTTDATDEQTLLPGFALTLETQRNIYHRPETQRLAMATHRFDAEVYHVAQPLIGAAVYRAAELVNTRDVMLLAGPASVYFDDSYVGVTELAAVAPGEPLRIGLGADPLVSAQRTLVTRDERERANSRIIDLTYRFAVRNSHTGPIDLRLLDRLPQAAKGSGLDLSVTRGQQPLSDDVTYVTHERPAGLLRWDVQVPAATGSAPWVLDYGYTLTLDRSFHLAIARAAKEVSLSPTGEPGRGWQWQR